jgi:hypothetical protein
MSDIEVRIIDRTPNPALKSITQSTTTVDIDENTTDTYTVVLDADPIGDVVYFLQLPTETHKKPKITDLNKLNRNIRYMHQNIAHGNSVITTTSNGV